MGWLEQFNEIFIHTDVDGCFDLTFHCKIMLIGSLCYALDVTHERFLVLFTFETVMALHVNI